ncbi:MAG: thiamine phosphate synthase [Proteobacteria bacterium]|nr:thiamine phosphate synthase [Pseudomonadota bacterium]MCL2307668.1 thiamine phosphate synthase [Pseudomonadota bacterium]
MTNLTTPRAAFDLSLYLVLDPDMCGGGVADMVRVTEAALNGGVTVVQLRALKWRKRAFWDAACALQPLCRSHRVPLIINDHVDVALAVDADGVHVGQQDLPAKEVRRLLGESKIIGVSVSNAQQWREIETGVVDYIGVGPVQLTATKPEAGPALGVDGLRSLLATMRSPTSTLKTVAIGSVNVNNARAVMETGVDGIAVVSAICASKAPEEAARALCEVIGS